jgi:ABC-2 type transport system permease protein
MRRLLALCCKELLLLSRDRHGLLLLFAMPAVFILVMSLALRGAFDARRAPTISLILDNRDGAPLSLQFAKGLHELPSFTVTDTDNSEGPATRVLIEPGFSELLATRYDFADDFLAGAAEPGLLDLQYSPTLPAQLRVAVRMAVSQALISVQTDYLLRVVLERPESEMAKLRYLFDPQHLPIEQDLTSAEGTERAAPNAVQQSVPAWLIFALFFTVTPFATSLVIERDQGSLLRLRVLNVSGSLLFASKLLPYYVVNMLQTVLMLLVGMYLVPALGGERLALGQSSAGLWLIASATSLAAIGLALLVAVNVRSILQATAAGAALCLLMGALGGIMVPKMVMPAGMQTLAQISPMAWALEGWWDILLRGGDWRSVLPECATLLLFAAACLGVAALSFRYRQTG